MTSVINRQLLLSGNKIIFLFCLFLFFSCSTSKKVASKDGQIVKSNDDAKKKETEVIDTQKETEVITTPKQEEVKKEEATPKDVKANDAAAKKLIQRKITVLLPYSDDDQRYLQFYGGLKIAADELEYEGNNIEIEVVEARENADFSFMDFSTTDVVFAPNNETQIKKLIEKTQNQKTKIVSSWFSLSSVENSPNYLQLKPSLRSHFKAMLQHISSNFELKDVAIVCRNTKADQAWLKYFQAQAKEIFGSDMVKPIMEHFVIDDSITFGSQVFTNAIYSKNKKVFILPNYSYKDENYLYGVMRRLNAEKGDRQIHVYGMPIIKDSDQMNFDYFRNLNVKVPSSRWIDYESEEVKAFNLKFYDKFGSLADAEAYEGFDNFLFIARNLVNNGEDLFKNMDTNNYYIHTNFDVHPFKSEDSNNDVDYYENQHLDILEFNGKSFVKSN